MYSIGVDVGGTVIKAGVVDDQGKIIAFNSVKTNHNVESYINSIIKLIDSVIEKAKITLNQVKGIGFGFPGMVSNEKGKVDYLPNVKGFENVDFVKRIKQRFNVEIRISNDANVATLAEVKYGSAKGVQNAIMLTLGTGVGGGIIIDGKLYEGQDSKGAELGHTTLILGGKQCGCGRKGCLETYVSTKALVEMAKESMQKDKDCVLWQLVEGDINALNGILFFKGLELGDKTVKSVFDLYIEYLSEGILNFCNIFRPEVIILGGGISAQGKVLTDRIEEYCKNRNYGIQGAPQVKIVCAVLGNKAGVIGASALI